jgi:hypothetical protein
VLFAGYDDDEGDFWGPELFDASTEMFTTTGDRVSASWIYFFRASAGGLREALVLSQSSRDDHSSSERSR